MSERLEWTDEQLALAAKLKADYARRCSTRWGRFLLWLLRKTT